MGKLYYGSTVWSNTSAANIRKLQVLFQVVRDGSFSLLSGPTSEKLGLIKLNDKLLINSVESSKGLTKEDVLTEYKDVFTGLGYTGDYKIEVTEEAIPKQDPPRSVPVALRDDPNTKRDEMEKQEILSKVREPTDWVNSAMYIKKPGKFEYALIQKS